MKHIVTVQFQESYNNQRPTDEALNREVIYTDNIGNVPSIDDYVSFDNIGEENTIYKVKTRFFNYKYSEKSDDWSVFVNIVVEKQPVEVESRLIKH